MKRSSKQELHDLYQSVRSIREGQNTKFSLEAVFDILTQYHKEDWLLPLELYELVVSREPKFAAKILAHLDEVKSNRPKIAHLIESGLTTIQENQNQKTN